MILYWRGMKTILFAIKLRVQLTSVYDFLFWLGIIFPAVHAVLLRQKMVE